MDNRRNREGNNRDVLEIIADAVSHAPTLEELEQKKMDFFFPHRIFLGRDAMSIPFSRSSRFSTPTRNRKERR